MTKYFYSDPLAAAWMAKHFGMKLTRTHCHRGDRMFGESMRPVPLWIFARDVENQISEAVKYYMQPDSRPLLEPRAGDILSDGQRGFASLREIGDTGWPNANDGLQLINDHFCKIIQRDGKPFHWPEVEA